MQCLRKKVSHRFKCPETYRGKTPLLQHYRGVRRGRQCRVVCCIKGCNTLHKHTHQSVEDSAHTNTLHRPHMEVGPALALGISCIVSAEINGFSWSCHYFLPLFTQHPSLPATLTHLTPTLSFKLTTIGTKALSKMASMAPRRPRMMTPNLPVIISTLPTRNCPLEMAPVVTRKPRMTDLPSLTPYKGMSLTLWGGPQAPTHRLPNLWPHKNHCSITDN